MSNIYKFNHKFLPILAPPPLSAIQLQYRSKRRGFHFYVQGQTKEICRKLYGQKIGLKLNKQEVVFDTVICSYTLTFDNSAYTRALEITSATKESSLPIRAAVLFEMFPFCILFQVWRKDSCATTKLRKMTDLALISTQKDLTVTCMGVALQQVIPKMIKKKITSFFELVKPLIEFKVLSKRTSTNYIYR